MPLVEEKDTFTKGYLSPKKLEDSKLYTFRALGYKKTEGGQYPDKEGYTTEYEFEIQDEELKELFARDDGSVTFTCGSKGMKKEFFNKGIEAGDLFTLKKTGEGFQTKYEVQKIEK